MIQYLDKFEETTFQFVIESLDSDQAGFVAGEAASLVINRDIWEKMGRPSSVEAAVK